MAEATPLTKHDVSQQPLSIPLHLRAYRRDDLEAMFRMDELCFEPNFRFSKATMRRFAEARYARVVIGEIAGEMAGFCIVHLPRAQGADVGYVVTLDVAPEHRRAGLASALMKEAECKARTGNCTLMFLHVFAGNEAAIRFYRRQGYRHVSDAKDFYGWGVDGHLYRKELMPSASTGG